MECVFGRLKGRFKVLHGVTDRHSHATNARMICAAVVLHNLPIDIGNDSNFDWVRNDWDREQSRQLMGVVSQNLDRTQAEVDLAEAKKNAYMENFYGHYYEEEKYIMQSIRVVVFHCARHLCNEVRGGLGHLMEALYALKNCRACLLYRLRSLNCTSKSFGCLHSAARSSFVRLSLRSKHFFDCLKSLLDCDLDHVD